MARQRKVLGEEIGKRLVGWLNAAKKKASHRRIERFLDNLGQICEWDVTRPSAKSLQAMLSEKLPSFIDVAKSPDSTDHLMDSRPDVRAVRKELARHRFSLRIVHNPENPDENLTLAWDLKSELQRVLLLLMRIDEFGQLRRIRRCRHCRRWFFARKEDHWQCSEKCRVAFHQSSPKFKRERAAYMRRRRKEDRELEHRILLQVDEGKRKN